MYAVFFAHPGSIFFILFMILAIVLITACAIGIWAWWIADVIIFATNQREDGNGCELTPDLWGKPLFIHQTTCMYSYNILCVWGIDHYMVSGWLLGGHLWGVDSFYWSRQVGMVNLSPINEMGGESLGGKAIAFATLM